MSEEAKNRPWILIIFSILAVILTITGIIELSKDFGSILGYAMLGVGLGGLIASLGEISADYFPEKNKKDKEKK